LIERADVVVIDRHELASQTSPRAAGLMGSVDDLERKAAWQYRHFYGVA
jgi:hypothetical protein